MHTPMATLRLSDGRTLEFQASGPSTGFPVVFHNSTPGSAIQYPRMCRAVHARGLKLVTFSRAGYAGSSRLAGRAVADVASDVEALLDHLGAERCLTVGWSGGGPHALATAALLPGRVAAAASLSGFAPFEAAGLDFLAGMGQGNLNEFAATLAGEEVLREQLDAAVPAMRDADAAALRQGIAPMLEQVDRDFLTPTIAQELAAVVSAGLRAGADGWIDDDLAFVKPWGFSLEEIVVPTYLWQGGQDLMVPYSHGQWLARNIPGTAAELDPTQGHMTLGLGDVSPVLDRLVPHI
ncbi:alpha/beta fold hydrolase [Streptomyces sp. NPDC054775]